MDDKKDETLTGCSNDGLTRHLTPEQVENWRKILCGMLGPYALIMSVEDIHKMRDKFQNKINKLDG